MSFSHIFHDLDFHLFLALSEASHISQRLFAQRQPLGHGFRIGMLRSQQLTEDGVRRLKILFCLLLFSQCKIRRLQIIQSNRDIRMIVAIHGAMNRQRLLVTARGEVQLGHYASSNFANLAVQVGLHLCVGVGLHSSHAANHLATVFVLGCSGPKNCLQMAYAC